MNGLRCLSTLTFECAITLLHHEQSEYKLIAKDFVEKNDYWLKVFFLTLYMLINVSGVIDVIVLTY
jgi:hypothetical protein